MFQSAKQNKLSPIIFSIYLLLLAWLVLFKFATNLSEIPHIRSINLIPFYYSLTTSTQIKETLYNILIFVPFGVYVQIFREDWNPATKCAAFLLTSFLFEAFQFLFAIGVSDITDIIGNTVGGIAGILLCVTMKKIMPGKYVSVINAVGIIVEITAIGLLSLLLAANQ